MAILMRAEVPGMTKELYEKMISSIESKIKAAPGFIAHAAGSIPGGWQVTEIWESQEQFNSWMNQVVMPAAMAEGMAPPIITMTPAHHSIIK